MPKFQDLTDRVFTRLTVLRRAPNNGRSVCWFCGCSCGNELSVRAASLMKGDTRSCGCLSSEVAFEKATRLFTRHGEAGGTSSEYRSWKNMRDRCRNPNNPQYADYGGRGIAVCARWEKYENFLIDMGRKPTGQHSIERKDNNQGYCPENCCWATRNEQAGNKRNNRLLEYAGRRMPMAVWAREFDLNVETFRSRLEQGQVLPHAGRPARGM